MTAEFPRIDGQRLWRSIEEMARIGALPRGGSRRVALSDEDRDARNLFAQWCREAGCELHVDQYGNQFGIRRGSSPDTPLVLFGSHLDTQPNGGRFDGIYGVLAGLEVMRTLQAADLKTDRSLAVVNWTNEEGVRFSPGLTGSKGFAGLLSEQDLAALVSRDGANFRDELARIGYLGTPPAFSIANYFEAHIEQGPVLEAAKLAVGVVAGVQGVRWFDVQVTGADRHAGTTPMSMRADSFMACSRMALAMRARALDISSDIRFTIGRVSVQPGSTNTVPGQTQFTIDLRHPDTEVLDRVEDLLTTLAASEAQVEGCKASVQRTFNLPPVAFEENAVATVAAATRINDLPTMRIVSGAMHDACALSTVAPTAMIFTACRSGISHSEDEFAEPEHLAAGCQVLLHAAVAASRLD
jgi:beta-ureidopropionase / N-carbamoyl-L-amino-acid hydrolase